MDSGDGGGDYDPCECVLSQEWATRRLINMIRQNQDYCTDNECYQEMGSEDPRGSTALLFVGFWFLIAAVLFFLRPRSSTSVPASKSLGGGGPSADPPAPTAN